MVKVQVGLPIDIHTAADALGVPGDEVVSGGATLIGTSGADLLYLSGGDQTALGGLGPDNYIVGGHFGHDVILDDEPPGGPPDPDILRFATVKSTDVTVTRDGLDLILTVNDTDEQIRIVGEFTGIQPSLWAAI